MGLCYLLVPMKVFPEPKIRLAVDKLHAFLVPNNKECREGGVSGDWILMGYD